MLEKIKGCLYGMAIGDGFGYPTEFLSIDEIKSKWSPNGPSAPEGNPIKVTDDTQMAIAVGNALMDSFEQGLSKPALEKSLIKSFIQWLIDPENNRAPGMTCLQSCEKLEKGLHWKKATNLNSKGCGANMRVAPIALLKAKAINNETISKIAQFQSAITHAHPTALMASDITVMTIVKILEGVKPNLLVQNLIDYAEGQRNIYHEDFLEDIWDRPPMRTQQDFTERGWDECIEKLKLIQKELENPNPLQNPCIITGEGWIAEEAFATALLCFLYYPENPKKAMQRAVLTSGDSDSIACLTGAFSGAYCGYSKLPKDWVNRIEYANELDRLTNFFAQ